MDSHAGSQILPNSRDKQGPHKKARAISKPARDSMAKKGPKPLDSHSRSRAPLLAQQHWQKEGKKQTLLVSHPPFLPKRALSRKKKTKNRSIWNLYKLTLSKPEERILFQHATCVQTRENQNKTESAMVRIFYWKQPCELSERLCQGFNLGADGLRIL